MSKVVICDCSVIAHKAIFAYERQLILKNSGQLKTDFIMKPDYVYFKTILSLLKKVGINKEDIIIMSLDARNSWRRYFYPEYKGQRHDARAKHVLIDWTKEYNRIDEINRKLYNSTNWHFLRLSDVLTGYDLSETEEAQRLNLPEKMEVYGIEADDIQAYATKFYSDKEVILITIDADIEMLCDRPNVKIFSPNLKYKGTKGCYKIINDPLKILANKIRKGDVSDNISIKENETKEDIEIRKIIIDLLHLPEFIEKPIHSILQNLKSREINYNNLPFQNSLGRKDNFDMIYNSDNVITYQDAEKITEHRNTRKKNKIIRKKKQEKILKQIESEHTFR